MNRQLRVTLLQKKMKMFSSKWLLFVVIALLCFGAASPSVAQADMAHVRVGHFVFGAPSVNLYIDGDSVMGQDALPTIFSPITLPSRYVDLPAGAHTFAVAPEGDKLSSAIISDQKFTLEAEHRYTLAMLGNADAKDIHFTLLDETTAIAQKDISLSAVTFLINNVYGIPAIDISLADKSIVNNLAYGDYFVMQDPTEGKGSKITAHGDATSVIFEYADAVGSPADVFAFFVFSGKFPGTMDEDYTAYYVGEYVGKLSLTKGGTVAVGNSVPVNITAMGQRVQYTLTLDKPMFLDILQSANDITLGADAYLRIYNAAGDTMFENDELRMDDNAQGIYDAGASGLSLNAGTYTLEAATFVDTGTGEFTLSVKASK